ncbi:carboxypeptidase Y-deficient [Coemansia sp. RSA 2320]|nr:carboxypeptidase Y-deficient [Coemansia sp. RSA 2320]
MSHSPLGKDATVRHVRRAARTLGPDASLGAAASDQIQAHGHARSHSVQLQRGSEDAAAGARRATMSAAAVTPGALACPVCGVQAGTLQQLNMHLDEMHFSSETAASADRARLTSTFTQQRRAAVSAARLADNRTERRLERLAAANGSTRVVAWESDAAVHACPLCERRFGLLAERRHHCRVCGRVVCAHCSSHVELASQAVRVCADCLRAVVRIRTRLAPPLPPATGLIGLYELMREGMRAADALLPAFNALLARATPDLARAAVLRRRLTTAFGEADRASKRIAALPHESPTALRLHSAIRRAAVQYLQTHMFTLSLVPSAKSLSSPSSSTTESPPPPSLPPPHSLPLPPLVDAEPPPVSPSPSSSTTKSGGGFAASLLSYVIAPRTLVAKPQEETTATPPQADAQKEARLAAMSQEEKLLSLDVLRDQRLRVQGYISEAQRERRLEDAMSLQVSLDDLDAELSIIERNL